MSDKEEEVAAELEDKVEEPKAAPAAKKAKKVLSQQRVCAHRLVPRMR